MKIARCQCSQSGKAGDITVKMARYKYGQNDKVLIWSKWQSVSAVITARYKYGQDGKVIVRSKWQGFGTLLSC